MPKNEKPSTPGPVAARPAESSSSNINSSHLSESSTLFQPRPSALSGQLPSLSGTPEVVLKLIASHLKDKDAIHAAMTSRQMYLSLYPEIKGAMVKALKQLIKEDDTTQARVLLQKNGYLLEEKDPWDPEGKAYQGLKSTPYQDALADPFQEEMRKVLGTTFPLKAEEKKSEGSLVLVSAERLQGRLEQLALQAKAYQESPSFEKDRKKAVEIMRLTNFAYETFLQKYEAWDKQDATAQPADDAWMRIGLVQDLWSKRLRKIFSGVEMVEMVEMDEDQIFENLKQDLPEPHFYGDPEDRWLPGTVKGCDLHLLIAEEKEDLNAAPFREKLATQSWYYCPTLVRQGEGASYYLYGPHIPLDEDKSEWQLKRIDDPKVVDLIRLGKPEEKENGQAVDFAQNKFRFNSLFADLYQYGHRAGLHMGSGHPEIFSTYNWPGRGGVRGCGMLTERLAELGARLNFAAVTALYEKRTESLAEHLKELEAYLPKPSGPQLPSPGSS